MAYINKKTRTLFFTTSPRTPGKMIPEIALLVDQFAAEPWNAQTQAAFSEALAQQDSFEGSINQKDPALSARDRITRAPKALGFVDLKPVVALTAAGEEYLYGNFPEEALLRQLLKFQLPSPYHRLSREPPVDFFVKPYLEIIRLVRHFGTLAFDELMLFGLQMTNFNKFGEIVGKIEEFRVAKAKARGSYKNFLDARCESVIREVYAEDIAAGHTKTRESKNSSAGAFIRTKRGNLRDYADACFRYLRATEAVAISQRGHSLSIAPDRVEEVDYLLETVPREPVFVDDEAAYKKYLFDPWAPKLLSDDRDLLAARLKLLDPQLAIDGMSTSDLKGHELLVRAERRQNRLDRQIHDIKRHRQYDSIQEVFDGILGQEFYDNPLMFEWNMWRAMVMLDGGQIEPNFKLDDEGQPLSTAAGNMPDIQCDYGDFRVVVEVTLQSGQRQYDNEGEPVARHLGRVKALTGQDAYCLFVAPRIHDATIAYFYTLHRVSVQHYGGKSVIVPVELAVFRKMLEGGLRAAFEPSPEHMKRLFEKSAGVAASAVDERAWFNAMRDYALGWPFGN